MIDVVSHWLAIVRRFIRLVGPRDDLPLSIYYDLDSTSIRNITSTIIDQQLQSLATSVYNLNPRTDQTTIKKFTAHSLRVGACAILHAMGFEGYEIKRLLRWKSDAFMDYLRNLTVLAQRQNRAITDATTIPCF